MQRVRCLAALIVLSALLAFADPPQAQAPEAGAAKAALGRWNDLVGKWRGVGQTKRNSRDGAWQDQLDVAWRFHEGQPSVVWAIEKGKLFEKLTWRYDAATKALQVVGTQGDEERVFSGKFDNQRWVGESAADAKGVVQRLTMTTVSENRFTMLIEQRPAQQSFATRVAEVAYQREGTKLAVAGSDGPECVVTGGRGTIAVMHEGKTYYVCCTGCRDAFNDDPAGILAEYAKKKAAKR